MEISDLEKLLQGSTPGPWYVLECMDKKFVAAKPVEGHPYFRMARNQDIGGHEEYPRIGADLNLIAAAPSLAAELLELKQRDRWIPCDEKLPPLGREVVVVIGGVTQIVPAYFDGDSWQWVGGGDSAPAKVVTHWRELPAPPEAKQVAGPGPGAS